MAHQTNIIIAPATNYVSQERRDQIHEWISGISGIPMEDLTTFANGFAESWISAFNDKIMSGCDENPEICPVWYEMYIIVSISDVNGALSAKVTLSSPSISGVMHETLNFV